jgi:hypothetical protein
MSVQVVINARGTAIKMVQIVVNDTITTLLINIWIVFSRESMEINSSNGTVIAVKINQIEGIKIKPAMIGDTIIENQTIAG